MDHPVEQQIAIAVVEREGHFLVGQRPQGVVLAGYWEFPGGKIAAGETPSTAAVRECREETGLVVDIAKALRTVHHRYDHDAMVLRFFLCRIHDDQASSPCDPFVWVARPVLAQLEFPPANRGVIQDLLRTKGNHTS